MRIAKKVQCTECLDYETIYLTLEDAIFYDLLLKDENRICKKCKEG